LPKESAFVADARGSIPAPRVTTAMGRGSVRGRGSARGRGQGQAHASTGRGRGKGNKRQAEATSSPTPVPTRGRARRNSFHEYQTSALPDLNEQVPEQTTEVVQISQNAPDVVN
jgi:hypothetical protein